MICRSNRKVIYYDSYDEDIVETAQQTARLPNDFIWLDERKSYKFKAWILYQMARIFSWFYCRLILRLRIENHITVNIINDKGCFLYGNHTQPIGDVFMPVQVLKYINCKRLHTIADQANLGIPILGKLLPSIGAIPIPKELHKMRDFKNVINTRISEGRCIVVYPEAHVWPYYTKIRPFQKGSFKFPVEYDVPAFCITTTYHLDKFRKKPQIVIHLDGPFYADKDLTLKKQQEKLSDMIFDCMKERSKSSTYEFIEYIKR